jgi:group I intron endonuclease
LGPIDWNFKTNKELALNRHTKAMGGKVIISCRIGKNNPMFGKTKSAEFWQKKDKSGENNPQFGVKKSEETLNSWGVRKKVYVYDSLNEKLLIEYKGTVECIKKLSIGKSTFAKYIDSGIPFKGKLLYRFPKF